jgi:hypothetical protein
MNKIYEIKLIINDKSNKYKASISKNGNYCIALCAKSNDEAYDILHEIVVGYDNRPIKYKKRIKDFILKDDCSRYMFLLRKENIDSYKRECDYK